jgi:hypothetical protein
MEWTLWATGWSEPTTNKILPGKPTPRSKYCLWAFSQFSTQIPPFAGVDPAGPGWCDPPQINFYWQPYPEESNFCLLAHAQLSTQIPPVGGVDSAGLGLG